MTDYRRTLQFLYDLQLFGIKVGLSNIRALLGYLGNPHRRYPIVHIAGTNGKGSTAAMLASVLTASGYRTGLYTSPHLVDFNERIRVDGNKISNDDLVSYAKLLKRKIEETRSTFFEATTAIAFQYFADRNVDVAVVETGLGGRLDATNIVNPVLSIITTIGIEHSEYLGRTHSKIAREKGGIIKKGIPCLVGTEVDDATAVLRTIALSKKSRFYHVQKCVSSELLESSLSGSRVGLVTKEREYPDVFVGLPGRYQSRNIGLAVAAAELLKTTGIFFKITFRTIEKGLREVRELSGLRGRLDVLRKNPLIIADVAHNPDGMRALVHSFRKLVYGKPVVVFGTMKDKDFHAMLETISPLARMVIGVKALTERALDSRAVVLDRHRSAVKSLDGISVQKGMNLACREVRPDESILVTGSHYVVGEAFQNLGIRP